MGSKKPRETQLALGAAPPNNGGHLTPALSPNSDKSRAGGGEGGGERPIMPSLVEYQIDGVAWRCGRFGQLAVELGEPPITAADLPLLQTALAGKERSWLIVRRLFGLMPVAPPPNYATEDLMSWDRQDLCVALGTSLAQLQQELDAVRGVWRGIVGNIQHSTSNTEHRSKVPIVPPAGEEEPLFRDDATLKEYDFPRVLFIDGDERDWFVKRVKDFAKLLLEKMTAGLARNALMTELQLRRLDEALSDPKKIKTGESEWRTAMKQRGDLDGTYNTQIAALQKLAPWATAIAGKYNLQGVMSDFTRAYQEFYATGEQTLVDGIFTATEIQVELRRSVQTPEPRYRAGLVVFLNAAKAGLWDPNWAGQFPPAQLKKLDAAWKAAAIAAGDESGERVPDLEKDGAEGEYEALQVKTGEHSTPNSDESRAGIQLPTSK